MTPEKAQQVQVFEHQNRLLTERVLIIQKEINRFESEVGKLRCQMQNNENRIHEILTRTRVE